MTEQKKDSTMKKDKTWKREVAIACLVFLAYLSLQDNKTEELNVLAWPTFLFVGAAYGMTWASNQTDYTGRRRRHGDYQPDPDF